MSTTALPGLADSLGRLGTETAFSVLARAKALEREGRDIIHLEIGEPDFNTPLHVCEVAAELLAGSNAWVLSDEVYSQMLYEGEFASVGKDNLRLGYANSRENLERALERMRKLLETL